MEVNQQDNEGEKHLDIQKSRDVGKIIDQGPSSDDGIGTLDESPSTPETFMSGVATIPTQPPLSTPGSSGPSTPAMRAWPTNLALISVPSTPTDVEEEDKWADLFHASRNSSEISKYAPSTSTAVTSMSRLDISTSDADDAENLCKQLEAKMEPLIQALKGFTRYNGKHKYSRRRALERQRSKVKRKLAKLWKELLILEQESQFKYAKRWSLNREIRNLFSVALKLTFPEYKDEESSIVCSVRDDGDYNCEDVLEIWPRLREEGKAHLGPRRVGWQIKRNVQLQQPEMIHRETEPFVFDIGFVTITLSGKWMAKSLHKLLRDGVDTWAPPLFIKNYLVNIYFPTCDRADLSDMDSLRRELIKKTLINILEYCEVDWCSMPCAMDLPREEHDKFQTTIKGEDVLIFPNAEGQDEPLIRAKRYSSDPMKDLKKLWYGLEKEKADWIVCLTRVQQQEYIKMCFSAAQHAKWRPLDHVEPKLSYAGYQSCSTSMEDLVGNLGDLASFLGRVEARVSKAGYTIEEALNCAVKYTFLKSHRLAVCTFSFEEMLNEEGNTFVYLLNTQIRNRSFTKKHRKVIDQLKKASELTLGEGEIWDEGVERVLVLHLLKFTQVIAMSCNPVLPHKLCKYLYDLCVIFNSYCYSWEVGVAETTLLLCKATEMVMEKCFQLLGITPESSSLGDKKSLGLPRSLLQVGRLNQDRDPPKKPNPRFQLFSVYIHIFRYPTPTQFILFGKISISDTHGVLYDGWGLPEAPDRGTVTLFDCDWVDQSRADNHGRLDLGNPSSSHQVPLSPFMDISTTLHATTLKEDALFPLARIDVPMKLAYFWEMEAETKCDTLHLKGKDGDLRMYFVLLKDAMDCAIEVTYDFKEDRKVQVEIYAYYGSNFFDTDDPCVKSFYTALLYDGRFNSEIAGNVGEVPLKRSMMSVPAKGSIVIEARLHDYGSKKHGYFDESCTFDSQPRGVFKKEIHGSCSCCSLSVKLVWSQG